MKLLLLVFHSLSFLGALVLGIINLKMGFDKSQSWTFPLRGHLKLGSFFYLLSFTTFISGLFLKRNSLTINIIGHKTISYFILFFLFVLGVSGLIKILNLYRLRLIYKLHPWLGLILLALFWAQFFNTLIYAFQQPIIKREGTINLKVFDFHKENTRIFIEKTITSSLWQIGFFSDSHFS
jgi:hypothetical protein